jgi:thioredoxin
MRDGPLSPRRTMQIRMHEGEKTEPRDRRHEIGGEPVHVTDADFNEMTGKHALVLVVFWASWCGWCQALAPTIEELAKEYVGRVLVGKLKADENPQTVKQFQVFKIPTMLVMKNGKEVDRIVGYLPFFTKRRIKTTLKKHLK